MTPLQIGVLGCIALVVLLAASMPVAFAMAVVGFVGFAAVVTPQAATTMLATDLYETFSSYSLTVIPLFLLMGQIAFHSGISRRLFNAAYHWFGPLPGGLLRHAPSIGQHPELDEHQRQQQHDRQRQRQFDERRAALAFPCDL